MDNRTCSIDGCTRAIGIPGSARGMCPKHYQRWNRHGDPLFGIRRERGSVAPPCAIDGCEKPRSARGWCGNHYESWRKYGDPLAARTPRPVTVGQRFGLWVVTGPEVRMYRTPEKPEGHRAVAVKCSCPLNTVRVITLSALFGGSTRSCGCRRSELTTRSNLENRHKFVTHGLSAHPLFDTWRKILSRCENPADKAWVNYGARGITYFPEWYDVTAFVAWIEEHLGPRPEGMSLDRVDVDGNYEPGNLRWADAWTQRHNRRPPMMCDCGNVNPVKAKFCFECGTVLVVAQKEAATSPWTPTTPMTS